MGLSERKVKQKIGNDPRNLAWRQDTTSFGQQYLLKAGHTPNTSLGLNPSSGLVNPIAVARKLDNSGIGIGRARREGGVDGNGGIGGAGGGLEEVLKRLAAAANGDGGSGSSTSSSSTTGGGSKILGGFAKAVVDEVVDTVVVREAVEAMPVASGSKAPATAVKSNRMAHRAKNRASKALASSTNALAIQEILGIPSGTPTPSGSGYGTPITSLAPDSDETPGGSSSTEFVDQHELISTNKMSVQDYFKQRMEEKQRAMKEAMRIAAGGSKEGGEPIVAVPVGGIRAPDVGEEEVVVVGGGAAAIVSIPAPVEEEVATPTDTATPESSTSSTTTPKAKKDKKDKKEKKDKKKDKKSKRKREDEDEGEDEDQTTTISNPDTPASETVETQGEDEKARKKREKKEKKEKKEKAKKQKVE